MGLLAYNKHFWLAQLKSRVVRFSSDTQSLSASDRHRHRPTAKATVGVGWSVLSLCRLRPAEYVETIVNMCKHLCMYMNMSIKIQSEKWFSAGLLPYKSSESSAHEGFVEKYPDNPSLIRDLGGSNISKHSRIQRIKTGQQHHASHIIILSYTIFLYIFLNLFHYHQNTRFPTLW